MESDYGTIVEMDADGSHQPEQLPALLAALEDADLVIGSRWVHGGSVVNWPLHRKALSVGGNIYTRVLLGMRVHDATAGFRAYRTDALRTMGLDQVASQGYCFQVDLTSRAVRAGLRVGEVPITFVEREIGDSKMSGDIMRESLLRITRWGAGAPRRPAAGSDAPGADDGTACRAAALRAAPQAALAGGGLPAPARRPDPGDRGHHRGGQGHRRLADPGPAGAGVAARRLAGAARGRPRLGRAHDGPQHRADAEPSARRRRPGAGRGHAAADARASSPTSWVSSSSCP